ncbi:MAG: D-alanyl-D-alanine carboxypeptidase family protein [Bacillota bacterium]|jgi:D-alanyl-D-alanine carboxypeptidase (penicillin-binding protein 5/6)
MKKIVICTIFLVCFCLNPQISLGKELDINAKAAVLVEMDSGQVLWEKNKDKLLPPASTTKILTALIAFDMGNLQKICTVSPKAASIGESSLHIKTGEQIKLEELLKGALLHSGNDACVAIAENLAGSESFFVYWMNLKAKLLGAVSSTFYNTNGLPDDRHLLTAYDLSLISCYAMQNKNFFSVVQKKYDIIGNGINKRYLKNTNKLLWKYPWCIGIKTGTTIAAGQCLVSAAEKNGERYIAVVLNSSDRYSDSLKLLEYGVNNFSRRTLFKENDVIGNVPVINGSQRTVPAVVSKRVSVFYQDSVNTPPKISLHIRKSVSAPVKKGNSMGYIEIIDYKGDIITRVNVVAGCEVSKISFPLSWFKYLIN